jgi:hypothetical protein
MNLTCRVYIGGQYESRRATPSRRWFKIKHHRWKTVEHPEGHRDRARPGGCQSREQPRDARGTRAGMSRCGELPAAIGECDDVPREHPLDTAHITGGGQLEEIM